MRKIKLTREERMIEDSLEHFVPVDKQEYEQIINAFLRGDLQPDLAEGILNRSTEGVIRDLQVPLRLDKVQKRAERIQKSSPRRLA
jgi:hypothetical protein